jgi:hypothetical protein
MRSAHCMGSAARHILQGDVDAVTLPAAVAACAWCQIPRMNRECWHGYAEILLAQGLRAFPKPLGPPEPAGLWEVSP